MKPPVIMDTHARRRVYRTRLPHATCTCIHQLPSQLLQPSQPVPSRLTLSLSRQRRRVTAACSDVWGHTKVQVRSPSAAALTVNCLSAATLANVGCRMEHWVVARSEQSHAASTCRQRPPWPRRRRRRLAHRPESHECGAAAWSAAFHVWRGGPGAPPPPQLVRVQRYARRGQLHLRASGAGESAAGHTALTPRAGATSAPSFSPGGHM